jgi:hypothetical protein
MNIENNYFVKYTIEEINKEDRVDDLSLEDAWYIYREKRKRYKKVVIGRIIEDIIWYSD